MNRNLSGSQFSEYDERPDPKGPGQQGVLFRKEAPARGTSDQRRGIYTDKWGDQKDHRLERGRATGMLPGDGVLYHGTSSRLKPGSLITPGKSANFEPYENGFGNGNTLDVNHEHVFATPHLHDAYRYAKVSQEVQSSQRGTRRGAHVYEVQPTGPVQTDAEDSDSRHSYSDQAESFQSKTPYRVLRALPIAHAQEEYRAYHEDELGSEPGAYPYAPKPPMNYRMEF